MPRSIGRYEVVEELGRGGLGAVFRAHDPELDRQVAIKLLHHPQTEVARRRFEREGRALSGLDHPNLVRVFDVGVQGSDPYLVMEYVPGPTLQQRLDREGPLPEDEAVALTRDLAHALAQVHEHGILHRDVKPSNVILSPHGPRLTDFGLVRELDGELSVTRLSRTGELLGTPGYWAPEQARGELERLGPAADIYGLGATLYAALTGRPPHMGIDLLDTLRAMERPAKAPSRRRPGLDPRLDRICMRCLQRRPGRRYTSAAELAVALEDLSQAPASPRRGKGSALFLVGLGAAGATLVLLVGDRGGERRSESPAQSTPTVRESAPEPDVQPSEPAAPGPRQILLESAREHERGKRYREAIADLTRAIELAPDLPGVYARRGHIYAERLRDFERGRLDYAAFRRLGGKDSHRRLYVEAMCNKQTRHYERALELYDRAIAMGAKHSPAFNQRGLVHVSLRQPELALADFRAALELESDMASALNNQADVLLLLNRLPEARASLERYLELKPEAVLARIQLGQLTAALGEREAGIRILTELLDELPPGRERQLAEQALARVQGR